MTKARELLRRRMQPTEEGTRKQVVVSVDTQSIDKLDQIARTLSAQSKKLVTRNALIEDAIDAYLQEALDELARAGVTLERGPVEEQEFDTVVLPAHMEGFQEVFLGENQWRYVRIDKNKLDRLRYLAIYVGKPLSRVTHYGKIKRFVLDEKEKKYVVELEGAPIQLEHAVPLGHASPAAVRAPRYTTLQRLLTAQSYGDL